ncbi:MAG: L,D-transpeptidase [Candidatus Shapirobacteria bacterium]|jgi:lipoprotein-anchoring transpeptidase ErfK/SrfK
MKIHLKILFSLFLFLAFLIILEPYLPKFLSKQNLINPGTIKDDYDKNAKIAIFNNQILSPPHDSPPTKLANILGDTNEYKRIEVDLTAQRVYAYEGNRQVYNFLISSGSWDRTPTGTFRIWTKIRSQKMSGGSKALGTYYYLPNVPYIMFFYNEKTSKAMGYSFHGTYWHNNFGVPMSHGCINMKTPEAAQLFSWAEVGTPVTISGKYQTVLPKAHEKS